MKTPADKSVAFVFGSHPMRDPKQCWQAKVSFPAGSDAKSVLPIEVTDGNGDPIRSAVFEFAGRRLEVKDGKTSITYADFIKGKHEVQLWLHRKGVAPVPGGLTFA